MATGIMALLAKPKGGGSKGPSSGGDMGSEEPADDVASSLREMFDALKAGDDTGAALAFRRAYESCSSGGDDEAPMSELGDEGSEEDDLDL